MSLPSYQLEVCVADYSNPVHGRDLIRLMNLYRSDPMGGVGIMRPDEEKRLLEGLLKSPNALTILLYKDKKCIALANCFINYSTFQLAPYMNIHDVCVDPDCRGEGLGRALLVSCLKIAREKECCRVNLEVRADNEVAMLLYRSLGFVTCTPNMHFWEKRF